MMANLIDTLSKLGMISPSARTTQLKDKTASKLTFKDGERVGFKCLKNFNDDELSTYRLPRSGAVDIVSYLQKHWLYMNDPTKWGDQKWLETKLRPSHANNLQVVLNIKNRDDKEDIENRYDLINFYNREVVRLITTNAHDSSGYESLYRVQVLTDKDKVQQQENYAPGTFPTRLEILKNNSDPAAALRAQSWGDLLNLTSVKEVSSEMEVQHVIGSVIRKIFQLPGRSVSSDAAMRFPDVLQMSPGHHPKPDFVTRRQIDIPSEDLRGLWPALIVGEAKQQRTGTGKSGDASASFQVQMQAAVYPTLCILLLMHYQRNRERHATTRLPENFFLYGIYMDESEVRIYAHFPYYDNARWGFAQVMMASYEIPDSLDISTKAANANLHMAIGLHTARAHAESLDQAFADQWQAEWVAVREMLEPQWREDVIAAAKKAEEKRREKAEAKQLTQADQQETEKPKKEGGNKDGSRQTGTKPQGSQPKLTSLGKDLAKLKIKEKEEEERIAAQKREREERYMNRDEKKASSEPRSTT